MLTFPKNNRTFLKFIELTTVPSFLTTSKKECKIGLTISVKHQPDNYWSGQDFQNVRL